jgi:5-methylcytosine-specific restriction enzyme subunit McrC
MIRTTLNRAVPLEIAEYQHRRALVPPPTESDVHLADKLMGDGSNPRLAVHWLANGEVDITASSWVGVVRFTHLDVHIVPKLVGGALRVLRMLDYAAGINMLRRLPANRPLPGNGSDLFDLICLLLAEESEVLIRDGLLRDYRATDDTIKVLRGRLRCRDQYLRHFGRLDRLECRFDEYDSDTPENQLVAAALILARRRAQDPDIRFALARLGGVFAEACQPTTAEIDWYDSAIQYDRRNTHYRSAHELSRLVLRGAAFDDLYDTTGGNVTAFLIDMNKVFEQFATRLVSEALAGTSLRSSAQRRIRAVICNDQTKKSHSTITPDLVVEDVATGRSVPVDIKYKQYDVRKISTSDLYQSFLYAYALGDDSEERRAGILYPTNDATKPQRLSIRPLRGPTAARIAGAGIDVPGALESLGSAARASLFEEVRSTIAVLTGFDCK